MSGCQDVVEQGGLAAAEEAGQHRDGDASVAFCRHSVLFLGVSTPQQRARQVAVRRWRYAKTERGFVTVKSAVESAWAGYQPLKTPSVRIFHPNSPLIG